MKAIINEDERLVCVITIGYGETNGVVRKSKTIDEVNKSKNYPDWYKKGIEFALLAPTAMNQQKFKFEYLGDDNVRVLSGRGAMTKIDLGIVKNHFELGANISVNWK
ncbi:MAG: nitroreductase family protein [Bacilli bacterium]|nr:nitroreductase family protein [Bacilli bacterium]